MLLSSVFCVKYFVKTSAGKAGAKGADAKKIMKKSAVAKPNTIKSLFMNSNVKRPAEVCFPLFCVAVSSADLNLNLNTLHLFVLLH